MSFAVVVQLLRNALCVLKSLLPRSHALMAPIAVVAGKKLATPSLLELGIAVTQFAAVVFSAQSGLTSIFTGAVYLRDADWTQEQLDRLLITSPSSENIVLIQGARIEQRSRLLSLVTGLSDLPIAFSFVFLTLSSLKLTGSTHPKPVIDGILLSEVSIAIYLCVMLSAWLEKVAEARRLHRLADALTQVDEIAIDKEELLTTIYDAGYAQNISRALEHMDPEYALIAKHALPVESQQQAVSEALSRLTKAEDSRRDLPEKLEGLSAQAMGLGLLEAVLFGLNLIAWYGYLIAALTFYIPEHSQPSWFATAKLSLSHSDADFWGNFSGDLAWTVEPLLLLFVAPLLKTQVEVAHKATKRTIGKRANKKAKSD